MTLAELMAMAGGAGTNPPRHLSGMGRQQSMAGSLGALLGGGVTGQQRRPMPGANSPTASGSYRWDWHRGLVPTSRVVGQNYNFEEINNMARYGSARPGAYTPPQLAPVERHAFPIGDWGGMQRAVGQQRQLDSRAYGPTLGSLLGGGY